MSRVGAHGVWIGAVLLYGTVHSLSGTHVAMLAAVVSLAAVSRTTRDLVVSLLPIVLFLWIYDLMVIFQERAWHVVVVEPVYRLEQTLFGWMTAQPGDLGPVDWFRDHHHIVLDGLGGLWYLTHVPAIILFALYLWGRSRGESTEEPSTRRRLDRLLWGFFAMSIVGLALQAWCPVAPPWYVEQFGFAPPGHPIEADPAGLARVDAQLGVAYFETIYSENAYIFGAIPSLHVASPVWLTLHVRHPVGRPLAWGFALAMAFFGVYLGHHYIVDVIAGAALAGAVYLPLAHTSLRHWPPRLRRAIHAALFVPRARRRTS